MKKTVLALLIASTCQPALSYANNTNNNEEETIVVTASRTQQEKFDVLAAVDVFDRESIERIQPVSIGDLLSRVAGISTTVSGSKANTTSLFVRGSNSDHVLILVNGIRVGSATLGSKDLSSIAVNLIDRVEVIKGPRAALWGSDAIGGVIQIFTRQFSNGEGEIGASIGHDNYQQLYATVGLGNEDHTYTLTASGERSDGFDVQRGNEPDDDGYNHKAISINGKSVFSNTYSLEVNAQLEDGNTQFDNSFGGNELDHSNHALLLRNHINLDNVDLQFSYANSRDYSLTHGKDAFPSLFETKRDQLNALALFTLDEKTEILWGADWLDESVNSNTLYSKDNRETLATFATARHQLDKLKLEATVRYDDIKNVDSETTYQLSAGYHISDAWLIAFNHGKAFKAPSFNELYYPSSPFFEGNKDLVSETAENSELLARYESEDYSAEVTFYYTDFDNLIGSGFNENNISTPVNINKVKIKGAEATINATLLDIDHRLTLSHTDAEDQSNNTQLVSRPYFTANYAASYQFDLLTLGLDVQHRGTTVSGFFAERLGAYTLFNLTAQYQVMDNLVVNTKVSNLSDKEYQSNASYNADGRGFNIGVKYSF